MVGKYGSMLTKDVRYVDQGTFNSRGIKVNSCCRYCNFALLWCYILARLHDNLKMRRKLLYTLFMFLFTGFRRPTVEDTGRWSGFQWYHSSYWVCISYCRQQRSGKCKKNVGSINFLILKLIKPSVYLLFAVIKMDLSLL